MSAALHPGQKIQRYVIERVLGMGGFGVVYLAFHETLEYQVVIKEYLPKGLARRVEGGRVEPVSSAAADPFQQSLLKFRKECEALLMLEHPNIVYVYDCFFALGTAYLVMHREVGCTLWERFASQMQTEQSPISWAQLSASLPGILAGLEYIHSRRLVHRDIKPGNIFLRDSMFASPLLIDFGAVKFTGGFVSRYAQNTPIYAALEQEYDLFPIGPWTDIHALGITMIELLTGSRPGTAYERQDDQVKTGQDSLLPFLSQIAAGYGSAVAEALRDATVLSPEFRFQSVADFRSALPAC